MLTDLPLRRRRRDARRSSARWWPCWRSPTTRPASPRSTIPRYGLTAGICTDSLALSTDFAARAQAGVVKVNRPTAGLDLNVPFGGVKDSSTNTFREQGKSALDFFTWGKTVYTGV